MEEKQAYRPTGINDYVGIGIDFETGGLNCVDNPITQIALIAFRLKDLEVMGKYQALIYPYNKKSAKKRLKKKGDESSGTLMTYTETALKYSNITMEQLYENGEDIEKVGNEAIKFIEKHTLSKARNGRPFLIGHNIQFDLGFWQQLMFYSGNEKNEPKVLAGNKDFYGNFQAHYIDSIDIAKAIFANDEHIDKYKLENIAERMGFPMYDAHDAMADTDACVNIYLSSANSLRAGGGAMGGDVIVEQDKLREGFKI